MGRHILVSSGPANECDSGEVAPSRVSPENESGACHGGGVASAVAPQWRRRALWVGRG